MCDWIKTVQGWADRRRRLRDCVAWWNLGLPRLVLSPELAPIHRRIAVFARFNRDSRLLVLDRPPWRANPLMLWPEMDTAFVSSDGNGGEPPARV
jgi:hypothetical protein